MQKEARNSNTLMFNKSIMSADSALELLIDAAEITTKTEIIDIEDCLDLILAENIKSSINVPDFDNSAMDGYVIAIKKEDFAKEKFSFKIVDRIAAGSSIKELPINCAARIFTGAPIPKNANTVIMQEECEISADTYTININRKIKINENIRLKGNDIQKDKIILVKGLKIKPQDIAILSSIGIKKVKVFKKIIVGTFFTGNELIEPGNPIKKGQIYNSNKYAIISLLQKTGCEVINLGNIKDSLEITKKSISSLIDKCDIIITTGGVSVGEEDYVKKAITSLGKLNLWKIRMKPGKPLAFAKIKKTFFIGLPGNPVSSFITFIIFALPFIRKMQGRNQIKTKSFKVRADFECKKPKPRIEYARVRIEYEDDIAFAKLYPKQGSDIMSSLVWADGIIEIPENTKFKKGYLLDYYPLERLML